MGHGPCSVFRQTSCSEVPFRFEKRVVSALVFFMLRPTTRGFFVIIPLHPLTDYCLWFISQSKLRVEVLTGIVWPVSNPVLFAFPAQCSSGVPQLAVAAAPRVPVHRHQKGFRSSGVFHLPVSPSPFEIQDLA